jgi:subtilase family serine protease
MNNPVLKPLAASLAALAVVFSACSPASAQKPVPRIASAIDSSSRVTLTGSRPLRALAANDVGVVPPGTQLQGMTLVFNRSAEQQTALDALIAAQQDPASPSYHQWLTPAQFGARFGMADADLAAAEAWLQQQGFSIDGVSNSRDRIRFTGTAAQAAAAFGTELHYYRAAGQTESHMAPATDISVPAALAPTLLGVANLSGFRPRSHLVQGVHPNFTSSQTGNHFMTPGDVATIYDINAAYNAGFTGVGQTIAIVGQSAIYASDIAAFQSAAGLPSKVPTLLLYPGTGTSTVYSGDESESDLDVEYSGAIAKGATILFVYTGNGNYGAFDALQYTIDNDLAPIVSSSYGTCEPALGQSEFNLLNAVLAQAATQGQTVISAAGDAGSSDCYGEYTPVSSAANTANNEQLSVDFPASSQYVTGLGGTEFPAADVAAAASPGTATTYWAATNGSDVVSSALSYIPEQVWNDDSSSVGLASGGGGVSIYAPRPTWQSGTAPGVAAITGTFRLVPDIALDSSPENAPYAYCTSDTTSYATGQTHSCNSGFRDSTSGDLTVAGGTSFAAPIFAGMLAILNQEKGYTAGQGVINGTLYTLASTPATYSSAFHDITVSGNQCLAGTSYCSGAPLTDYAAGTGYDQASGLGSVDLNNLIAAWPKNTTASGANFTLTASTVTTTNGTAANSTITVTPVGGYTGTVAFRIISANTVPYACYSVGNATVTGTAAVTATVAITTDVATCPSGTVPFVVAGSGSTVASLNAPAALTSGAAPSNAPAHRPQPLAAALAGALLLAGLSRRKLLRRKLLRNSLLRRGLTFSLLVVLGLAGMGLSGCSNSTNTPVSTTTTTTTTSSTVTTAGTYTLTVEGYNPSSTSQSATTTLTLTVN